MPSQKAKPAKAPATEVAAGADATPLQWQAQRRRTNREALLQAAIEVFARHGYAPATVEHILAAAKLSRATFYKHFAGKFAVAEAIAAEALPAMYAAFDQLSFDLASEDGIALWIIDLVALHRQRRPLLISLERLSESEPKIARVIGEERMDHLRRLGHRAPVFQLAFSAREETRIHMLLLVSQLSRFCVELATQNWPPNEALAIRVMAGIFHRFIAMMKAEIDGAVEAARATG